MTLWSEKYYNNSKDQKDMCNSDQTGAKEEKDHRMTGNSNVIESKEIRFNLNEAIRICIICRHNPSAVRYYAAYRKWYLDQIIPIASFLTGDIWVLLKDHSNSR